MTRRARDEQYEVRVLLYGCSHKPKFNAFSSPVKGDTITCYACGRGRLVIGVETGWSRAAMNCLNCPYQLRNTGKGKKYLVNTATRHANACGHTVTIVHDAVETVVKPQTHFQQPLIDNLLLP